MTDPVPTMALASGVTQVGSRRSRAAAALTVGFLVAPACASEAGEHESLAVGSLADFRDFVQPEIGPRCAAGSCHGRDWRPLRLYATGLHRQDPARTYIDEPISDDELHANALMVAGFAHVDEPAEAEILRKPLPLSLGGMAHGGGEVFADLDDPGYVALHDWIAASLDDDDDSTR